MSTSITEDVVRGLAKAEQEQQAEAKKAKEVTQGWVSVEELPSKKLPYPDIEVSVRPLTWAEEKALAQTKSISEQIKLVGRGIHSTVPLLDLTSGDFEYLVLMRRLVSYGDESFNMTHVCKKCGSKHTTEIKTSDIDIQELPINKLPVVIEDSATGLVLEMGPLSMRDFIREADNPKRADVEQRIYACMFKNMSKQEAMKLLNEADAALGQYIEEVASENLLHRVKPMKAVCPDCGEEYEVNFNILGTEAMFSPIGKAKRFNTH